MQSPSQTPFKTIKALIAASRREILQTINTGIVHTYFNIGKLIVEYQQQGKPRAVYAAKKYKND
jgi:hypothetical protein